MRVLDIGFIEVQASETVIPGQFRTFTMFLMRNADVLLQNGSCQTFAINYPEEGALLVIDVHCEINVAR